jgi:hypothetical protein
MKKTSALRYPETSKGYTEYIPMKNRIKPIPKPVVKRKYKPKPNPLLLPLYINSKMPYGKYKGNSVEWVMENDNKYWDWFSMVHKAPILYRIKK